MGIASNILHRSFNGNTRRASQLMIQHWSLAAAALSKAAAGKELSVPRVRQRVGLSQRDAYGRERNELALTPI